MDAGSYNEAASPPFAVRDSVFFMLVLFLVSIHCRGKETRNRTRMKKRT
jgi:hypothetical protein